MTACFLLPSQVNNALLITQGALTTLGLLLLDLAAAVQRTEDAGLELVCGQVNIWVTSIQFQLMCRLPLPLNLNPYFVLQLVCPVVQCLSNLLTEAAAETVGGPMHLQDERVLGSLIYPSAVLSPQTAQPAS